MNIVDKIVTSEARPLVDQMLLAQSPLNEIIRKVAEQYKLIFEVEDIERYRKESFIQDDSPMRQIARVTQDISNVEPPPTDEFSKLSLNFSFQKTNEDLELLYGRIRKLAPLAEKYPEDPTYDRRIKEYLSQAEAIRTRVYKHQYEQIRQAVLLTIGKKICTAAISILMPYIHKDFRMEAMRRFQASVEPLLDLKSMPEMPADITKESIKYEQ